MIDPRLLVALPVLAAALLPKAGSGLRRQPQIKPKPPLQFIGHDIRKPWSATVEGVLYRIEYERTALWSPMRYFLYFFPDGARLGDRLGDFRTLREAIDAANAHWQAMPLGSSLRRAPQSTSLHFEEENPLLTGGRKRWFGHRGEVMYTIEEPEALSDMTFRLLYSDINDDHILGRYPSFDSAVEAASKHDKRLRMGSPLRRAPINEGLRYRKPLKFDKRAGAEHWVCSTHNYVYEIQKHTVKADTWFHSTKEMYLGYYYRPNETQPNVVGDFESLDEAKGALERDWQMQRLPPRRKRPGSAARRSERGPNALGGGADVLRRAAMALHALDDEHFEGGCSTNTTTLKAFADEIGLPGVSVVFGQACLRSKPEQVYDEDVGGFRKVKPEWVMHSWLLVDGQVYDPTWEVVFGRPGARYKADSSAEVFLPVSEDEDLDFYLPRLLKAVGLSD